ncbi:MAG: lyase family protein [Rhabdaerophilum sp.]
MSVTPLDSALYRGLLGDPDIVSWLSDEAEIAAMIRAERALAIVQARLGIIPTEAGRWLAEHLSHIHIAPETLAAGVAKDGVVAPALVAALRAQLPPEAANWLHWGMTSQDAQDIALVLRLRDMLALFDQRLRDLIVALSRLAEANRNLPCLARTRMQAAAPTLFGLKAAQWFAPLIRHRERLREMRPRLLAIQLGGAAGNLAAFGAQALPLMDGLADELGLARAEPWHKGRDRIEELAGWLAMISSSLGTIGADIAMLSQSEVGEIRLTGAGGSSTLPQKQNPVLAEVLVSLARHAATLAGGVHQAGIHTHERDGAAWTLEWLTLPSLIATTGSALCRGMDLIDAIEIDAKQAQANLQATRGLVLAEAASFRLAAQMPRPAAIALVKRAVEASLNDERHFLDHLTDIAPDGVDLADLRQDGAGLGPGRALLERLLATASDHLKAG